MINEKADNKKEIDICNFYGFFIIVYYFLMDDFSCWKNGEGRTEGGFEHRITEEYGQYKRYI